MQNKVADYGRHLHNIEFLRNLTKNEVLWQTQSYTAVAFSSIRFQGMLLTIIKPFAWSTPLNAFKMGIMRQVIQQNYNDLLFETENKDESLSKLNDWQFLSENQRCNIAKIHA